MFVFGKFIANSILGSYRIGIKFAEPFIKLLYSDELKF